MKSTSWITSKLLLKKLSGSYRHVDTWSINSLNNFLSPSPKWDCTAQSQLELIYPVHLVYLTRPIFSISDSTSRRFPQYNLYIIWNTLKVIIINKKITCAKRNQKRILQMVNLPILLFSLLWISLLKVWF